jgi:hypothetical protein
MLSLRKNECPISMLSTSETYTWHSLTPFSHQLKRARPEIGQPSRHSKTTISRPRCYYRSKDYYGRQRRRQRHLLVMEEFPQSTVSRERTKGFESLTHSNEIHIRFRHVLIRSAVSCKLCKPRRLCHCRRSRSSQGVGARQLDRCRDGVK